MRENFFLNANELVDSLQRNDWKSYWTLIRKLIKGTSQNYSIRPLYDNDSNELIYDDKIKANLLNKYFCSISFVDDINHVPPDVPTGAWGMDFVSSPLFSTTPPFFKIFI